MIGRVKLRPRRIRHTEKGGDRKTDNMDSSCDSQVVIRSLAGLFDTPS